MPWRYSSLDACLDAWAASKGPEDVEQLLLGLQDLANRPLDELPGNRFPGLSPMWRWARVANMNVVFLVVEPEGVLSVVTITDE